MQASKNAARLHADHATDDAAAVGRNTLLETEIMALLQVRKNKLQLGGSSALFKEKGLLSVAAEG